MRDRDADDDVIEKRVEELLKKYPEARNHDTPMTVLYMKEYHNLDISGLLHIPPSKKDSAYFSLETLRRSRQIIQGKGLYPADEKIQILRAAEEKRMRERFRRKGQMSGELFENHEGEY